MSECIRCHSHASGLKTYIIEPNPSITFGQVDLSEPKPPDPIITSCVDCLTKEEMVKILAPLALFAAQYIVYEQHQRPDAVLPYLQYRVGPEFGDDLERKVREFLR